MKSLTGKFAVEGLMSSTKCLLQFRAVKCRHSSFGALTGNGGEALDLSLAALRTVGLNGFIMVLLIMSGEVFQAREIIAAIKDAKRYWVDLGYSNMEMRFAFLDMAHHEPRTICTDAEFGIDQAKKLGQLLRRHFKLWGYGKVTNAVFAAFHSRECIGIEQRIPVTRQNLDQVILGGLV